MLDILPVIDFTIEDISLEEGMVALLKKEVRKLNRYKNTRYALA